jgi:hypothetical protein
MLKCIFMFNIFTLHFKKSTFPPDIEIQNNISCLQKYNNFMKNVSFQFNSCCVCNEKKFMKWLIICNILYLN